jgi:hypothetical protein
MHIVSTESAAKPRRRPASKPAKPQASEKTKATFYLGAEAVKRLGVHAAMLGSDKSSLVEQLILDGLKRFKVSAWGGRPGESAESGDTTDIGS